MEPIGLAFGVLSAVVTAMGGPSAIISKIGGLLGGDKGADIAGKVSATATQVFGTTDPDKIKLAIQQDQSRLAAFVAQIDAETRAYAVEVEDRKDARARDMEIRRLPGEGGVPAGTNPRANVLLIGVFLMLIAILIGTLLYRASIPDSLMAMLSMIAGNMVGNLTQAFNFEFGSSRGSSEKSNTINNMAETAAKK